MAQNGDAPNSAGGEMETAGNAPSEDFDFDTALANIENRINQPSDDSDEGESDDAGDDADSLTVGETDDKAGDGEKPEEEADKGDQKPEDKTDKPDDKKADKKNEEGRPNERTTSYAKFKANSDAYAAVKPQIDAVGGVEKLGDVVGLVNDYGSVENVRAAITQGEVLTDPEKATELIEAIASRPDSDAVLGKLFFQVLDDPESGAQNALIAFNDGIIRNYGLPQDLQLSGEEFEKFLAYAVNRFKDDKEDFFDEIDGEIQRLNINLPSKLDKSNPVYRELEAERQKRRDLEAQLKTNGKKADSDAGEPAEVAQMNGVLTGYTTVVGEAVQSQIPTVLKKSVAETLPTDTPELKSAKEAFHEVLNAWARVQIGNNTEFVDRVVKNLGYLTDPKFSNNPHVIRFKTGINSTAAAAIKQQFDKMLPLLTVVRAAKKEDADKDDPTKIINGDRKTSITEGKTGKKTSLKDSKDPFGDALNDIESRFR